MEDPGGSIWGYLALLIFLIASNAFFAMSELAVIGLNDMKLRHMAGEGNRTAKLLCRMVEEPSRFLSTVQVGVTLSGMLASAVAADTFAELIVRHVAVPFLSPGALRIISLIVITLLLSFVTIVFGELVPKRLAMQYSEKIAFKLAGILNFCYLFEKPFVVMLSASTNAVVRLLGLDPGADQNQVTEEEIRMMLDVGNEKGSIEQSEKDMINNIFEFDDRSVAEVMTHRTDMVAVPQTADLSKVVELAIETGYSRIPVYEDDIDGVIGILYVKDLLCLIGDHEQPFDARKYMRKVLFVPENMRCGDLFVQFKAKKVQIAVAVDEYGGTAGIVSMEDLLESIVGNIQDEYDDEEEEISQLSADCYLLDGAVSVSDVERLFDIELDEEGELDYDTIGGLLTDLLDGIPAPGEHPSVDYKGLRFTVLLSEERRIARVRAERTGGEADE